MYVKLEKRRHIARSLKSHYLDIHMGPPTSQVKGVCALAGTGDPGLRD